MPGTRKRDDGQDALDVCDIVQSPAGAQPHLPRPYRKRSTRYPTHGSFVSHAIRVWSAHLLLMATPKVLALVFLGPAHGGMGRAAARVDMTSRYQSDNRYVA